MSKVLVIHGPNLNLLGTRETDIYGRTSLSDIDAMIESIAKAKGIGIESFQSNHEGDIVQKIQDANGEGADVIIINPAAYTHTSVAIRDAICAVSIPVIEVHLSNIYAREDFRKTSLISPVVAGVISGFGPKSYSLAVSAAAQLLKKG